MLSGYYKTQFQFEMKLIVSFLHSRTRLPALVVGRRGIELPDGLFLECRRRGRADAWTTRLGMKVKHWGETLLSKKNI